MKHASPRVCLQRTLGCGSGGILDCHQPLNLNHTSGVTSLEVTICLNLSQSSPCGILRINCSSNASSSSSESSSRSYDPNGDVPGACDAVLSPSFSFSFVGCCLCGRTSGGGGHDFAGSVNVAGAGVQVVVSILCGRIDVGGGSGGVARWVGGDSDVCSWHRWIDG